MFFVIKPRTGDDIEIALRMLAGYQVEFQVIKDGKYIYDTPNVIAAILYNFEAGDNLLFKINNELIEGDLRMAEVEFQLNFTQEGGLICPVCEMDKEDETYSCGHITFETYINRW